MKIVSSLRFPFVAITIPFQLEKVARGTKEECCFLFLTNSEKDFKPFQTKIIKE